MAVVHNQSSNSPPQADLNHSSGNECPPDCKGSLDGAPRVMEEKEFFTPRDVADKTGVSADTIRRWIKDRKVPVKIRKEKGCYHLTPNQYEIIVQFVAETRASAQRAAADRVEQFINEASRHAEEHGNTQEDIDAAVDEAMEHVRRRKL